MATNPPKQPCVLTTCVCGLPAVVPKLAHGTLTLAAMMCPAFHLRRGSA